MRYRENITLLSVAQFWRASKPLECLVRLFLFFSFPDLHQYNADIVLTVSIIAVIVLNCALLIVISTVIYIQVLFSVVCA